MTDPERSGGAGDLPPLTWRKSSFSGSQGDCVEFAELADGRIAVRNSNQPEAGTLRLTRAEMAAWLAGVRAGEFDDLLH